MARVVYDTEKWHKTKSIVKEIEDDYTLNNEEIQERILEIVEEHRKREN